MELRQLEYFVAVAEEANFTRAAERVHISQSGVSAQIRQLEHDLGAALIDRSGRVATLTVAGVAALEHARAVLASVGSVRQAVDEVAGVVRGKLTVGMVTGCTITPLFDALAAFHDAHPGVELVLVEGNSDRLIESVRAGDIDLALVGIADSAPDDLTSLTIVSEALVAAVPVTHSLARQRTAKLRTVCRYPVVCLPLGTGVRSVFDQACSALEIKPNVALQASAPDAVSDLAARGLGVAILSESMAVSTGLHVVRLSDVVMPALLSLVWPTVPSPALRQLLAHCRSAFKRAG